MANGYKTHGWPEHCEAPKHRRIDAQECRRASYRSAEALCFDRRTRPTHAVDGSGYSNNDVEGHSSAGEALLLRRTSGDFQMVGDRRVH